MADIEDLKTKAKYPTSAHPQYLHKKSLKMELPSSRLNFTQSNEHQIKN